MIVLSLILCLLLKAVNTTANNPNGPYPTERTKKDGASFIIVNDMEP